MCGCLPGGAAGGLRQRDDSRLPDRPRPRGRRTGSDTPSPTGGITYVALGASDAFGVGTYDVNDDNWPAVLADDLGGSVHLVNLGIPGATVAEATRAELPIALMPSPAS